MKTRANASSVAEFIGGLSSDRQREESGALLDMMAEISGCEAVMWGPSIVGFGRYRYRRKDGSEHEFFRIGFSPRKNAMTVYVMPGFSAYEVLLAKLGRHKRSVSCLYLPKLEQVKMPVLRKLVQLSYEEMNRRYPELT